MCHVEEGLAILHRLGASERAQRAFCLHPLLQGDEALAANFERLDELTSDAQVLALALEYRSVANATLSPRVDELSVPEDIPLGPLPEVADMLRADKVQNYKDFLRYHQGSHPRSEELTRYFELWLMRLGVRERFDELCEELEERD
jgi:hypothetical protein